MRDLQTRYTLIVLLTFSINTHSQSLEDYSDVLNAKKVGKAITKKVKEDVSQRTLLGTITDNKGSIKYYVVTEFLKVKAAIVYHGHSSILFFDPKKKLVLTSELSMPYELPCKLENNSLYFNYSENDTARIYIENVSILRSMLCVKPKSCYDILSP